MSRVTAIFTHPANNVFSICGDFGELSEKSFGALPSALVEKVQHMMQIVGCAASNSTLSPTLYNLDESDASSWNAVYL